MEIAQSMEAAMKNAYNIKTSKTADNAKQHMSHNPPASTVYKVQVPGTKPKTTHLAQPGSHTYIKNSAQRYIFLVTDVMDLIQQISVDLKRQ